MDTNEKHILKPGTVLDDRYIVQEVLGEGGFGITYRALHQRVNRQVAVKEFFLRDQNFRDISSSPILQVTGKENREYFEREKENFVREARVLGEFSGESHMVSILDYFEENGTAYMVMELLEGETLKQYLELHGTMTPEEAFEKFLSVMELLEKLHRRNIIHRDISPENLMVMPDGTWKLLDFGSARNYDVNLEKTYSIIVKKGYAPPEQYRKNAKQGPWTDVYGLTAAIYTCITGQAPQDALSRILYDETKWPAEWGISIAPEAESILKRGMELAWEQRYSSMEEMRSAVLEYLDRRACEKEKERSVNKRRWLLPGAVLAVCICVLFAVFGHYFLPEKGQQMFRDVETETFVVCPSEDMTLSEFQSVKKILARRLELLAGESQVRMEDIENGQIRITVPRQVFQDREIEGVLSNDILSSMDLRTAYGSAPEDAIELGPEDFLDVQVCDGALPGKADGGTGKEQGEWHLKLTLTDETGGKLEALADEAGELSLYQGDFLHERSFSLQTAGDGCTFYLEGEGEKEPYARLLAYNLTSSRYEEDLSFTYEIPAVWEEPRKITTAGALQCARGELEGEIYCARYGDDLPADDSETLSDGERTDLISNLKKRLDEVGIAYAFGIAAEDEDDFVIAVERDKLCLEIMEFLGCVSYDIGIGSQWETCSTFTYGAPTVELRKGSFEVFVDEIDRAEVEKSLKKSREEGLTTWYLYVNCRPLAMCDIQKDADGERLIFRRLCSYHEPEITEDNSGILRLLKAVSETDGYFTSYTREAAQYIDADGNLELMATSETEKYSLLLMQDRLEEIRQTAEGLAPGIRIQITWTWSSGPELYIVIPMEYGENFAQKYLGLFQQVYESCDLGRGDFEGFIVYWEGEQGKLGERLRLLMTRNVNKRRMDCHGLFYGGRLETCKKEAEAYVAGSSFYQGLRSKDYEWSFEP